MPSVLNLGTIFPTGSAPLPPTAVEAVPTGETTATISWACEALYPDNATSILVEISDDDGETWSTVDTSTDIAAGSVDATGLTAGTDYVARVTSRNAWGDTVGQQTADFTTPTAGPPDAPSGLAANTLSSTSISLSWTDNSDNDEGFDLQRDTENTFSDPVTLIDVPQHSALYTDTGLTPATEYFYRVRATNGAGDSTWSNTASATTEAAGDPAFNWTVETPAGLKSDLEQWNTDEQVRLGNDDSLWLWAVVPYDWDDSGYPGLAIGTHHTSGGVAIWRNNCATPGGALTFTRALPGELGTGEAYELGNIAGSVPIHDHDGDGRIDVNPIFKGSSVGHEIWALNSDDELEATAHNWSGAGTYIYKYVPNADLPATIHMHWWERPVTALEQGNRHVYTWNGTSYDHTEVQIPIPAGIPQAVIDAVLAACAAGNAVSGVEPSVHYCNMDLDNDGTDDLIVSVFCAYGASTLHKGWYLKNNGDGTYTDKTTDWGLPNTGWPIILEQRMGPMIWPYEGAGSLHKKIDGTGAMHLFVGGGGSSTCGVYKWNGTGYTRQTGPLTTQMSGNDVYPMQLWALPLKNQEDGYDLIYRRPRLSFVQIFMNDGTGAMTQWVANASGGSQKRHVAWDPWGFIPIDMDNDGLIDLVLGGNGGENLADGGRIAQILTIFRNATTDPGNYLKVKLLRPSGGNRRGVGGYVEALVPNTSTVIVRWLARPDGIPIHFGLGTRGTVDIRVTWHDSTTTTIEDVAASQTLTVTGEE